MFQDFIEGNIVEDGGTEAFGSGGVDGFVVPIGREGTRAGFGKGEKLWAFGFSMFAPLLFLA